MSTHNRPSARRRKTLSPSRVAALLRQSHKILGELQNEDDENSPPTYAACGDGGETPGKDDSEDDKEANSSADRTSRLLHGSVTCAWQGEAESAKVLEGELWVAEGSLHWTPSPMSDITNKTKAAQAGASSGGGLRLASTDVSWVRSLAGKKPTIEVKLASLSETVMLSFQGPGSVAAAVAAMDMFPDHMYHEKLSAASEELSPRDHFASSAAATSCLPALVREFMKEPRQSSGSRAIAKEVHSLTGYPLLPFGVVTEGADAEPLFDREKPPTDSEKRSLALVMMPLYESMNRARLQAAKESEELLDIRAERADGGSYRYLDLSTKQELSPNSYRARYFRGLASTGSGFHAPSNGLFPVSETGSGSEKEEEEEEEEVEVLVVKRGVSESAVASEESPVVSEVREQRPASPPAEPAPTGAVKQEEDEEVEVQLRPPASSLGATLEEVKLKAQQRLFEAIDAALQRYHHEIAWADAAFRAAERTEST